MTCSGDLLLWIELSFNTSYSIILVHLELFLPVASNLQSFRGKYREIWPSFLVALNKKESCITDVPVAIEKAEFRSNKTVLHKALW